MALRVTVVEAADLTVIRVDGRLADDGVAELDVACQGAKRPVVLDLTNLMTADDTGIRLLRRLVGEGLHLLGASPYAAMLLNADPPAETPAAHIARRRSRRPAGTPKRAPPPNQP